MVETVSQAYPDIKTRGRQGIELGLIDEQDEGHKGAIYTQKI